MRTSESDKFRESLRWALNLVRYPGGAAGAEEFAGKWNAACALLTVPAPVCHNCKTSSEDMRQICDKCFTAGVTAERANPGEEFADATTRKDV